MSSINIKRAVENIRSGTTVYTPVVELIVNSIQAIRTVKPTGGLIRLTILRTRQLDLIEKVAAVDGFVVRDDGVGFNQEHRNSFDTLYTALKAVDGGKGFGRFTCLKYFHHLTVESVFQDGDTRNKRSLCRSCCRGRPRRRWRSPCSTCGATGRGLNSRRWACCGAAP